MIPSSEVTRTKESRYLNWLLPLALVTVFILWRLSYLLLAHPFHLFVYMEEEFYRGMIGKEILHGLNLPLFDYRADDYSGGSFLIGVLSAALFKLFGLNAFVLKLVPLAFSSGALLCWYAWLNAYAGRRMAILFSLLFIFSPLVFTRYSLTALGDHPETTFFTAISMLCFFNVLASKRWPLVAAIFLGFFSGVGLWMAYIYCITIFSILIYWYFYDPSFYKKPAFGMTVLFFLLGFSPWILTSFFNQYQGMSIQGMPLPLLFSWKNILKRLWDFRASSPYLLFAVHWLPGNVPEISPLWTMRFYRFMFFIPIFGYAIGQIRKTLNLRPGSLPLSAPLFAALHLGVFLLVCQATEFKETRYFIPSQPFLYYLAIHSLVALTGLYCTPRLQCLSVGFYFSLLIFASLALHSKVFYPEYRGILLGLNPARINWILLSPACHTPEKCLDTYRRFSDKSKLDLDNLQYFQAGVTQKLLEEAPFKNPLQELENFIAQTPPELHASLTYYFGFEAMARENYDLAKALTMISPLKNKSEETFSLAAAGFFRHHSPKQDPNRIDRAAVAQLPQDLIPVFWQEQGFQWSENYLSQNPNDREMISAARSVITPFTETERRHFVEGIGMQLFLNWRLWPYKAHLFWDNPKEIPRDWFPFIFYGAGLGVEENQDHFRTLYRDMFYKHIPEEYHAFIQKGQQDYQHYVLKYAKPRR